MADLVICKSKRDPDQCNLVQKDMHYLEKYKYHRKLIYNTAAKNKSPEDWKITNNLHQKKRNLKKKLNTKN